MFCQVRIDAKIVKSTCFGEIVGVRWDLDIIFLALLALLKSNIKWHASQARPRYRLNIYSVYIKYCQTQEANAQSCEIFWNSLYQDAVITPKHIYLTSVHHKLLIYVKFIHDRWCISAVFHVPR